MYQEIDNESMQHLAPSVFAEAPWKNTSDKYAFIPTIQVVEAMRKEGFLPVMAAQSRARTSERVPFSRHMLRFRRAEDIGGVKVKGANLPELVLVNSHDGSSSYHLSAGIFRVVCSNGMVVKSSSFGDIRVRHVGDEDVVAAILESSHRIIGEMPKVIERISEFESVVLDEEQQVKYAEAALNLRYPADGSGKPAMTIEPVALLGARRVEDEGRSLWHTFNRVQENMIVGGLPGQGRTGKRTTTRSIAAVGANIHINKELWMLTEQTAEAFKEGKA